ncbi:hypothetical protein [Dysgonomonas sp. GY617]|uniref:hypothetical protein n=1 Tax=Dysgonomonas sp. GY617 TaxID=2780420 RepID=UPI001884635A|nr:hypothetical protein [Dysgonomonas sp. GY617]MBF0574408.1 hypothetical protein [Dysgonomonas sp. GY617]
MAQFIFKFLRADGSVVATRKKNFLYSSLAYGYAQTLLNSSYGDVDSIDVKRATSDSTTKKKSGVTDIRAALRAELARIESKKKKRKK